MKGIGYRRLGGRSALVGVLAIAVAISSFMSAVPALGSSPLLSLDVFDRNSIGWSYETNMTPDEYQEFFDEEVESRIQIDIEADEIAGEMRYMAVFQDKVDDRDQYVLSDMTEDSFTENNGEQRENNKRLVDVEIYRSGGEQRFAAIWLENLEGLDSHLSAGMTKTELIDYAEDMDDAGFMPTDIQLYEEAGNWLFAVIWLENPENLPWNMQIAVSNTSWETNYDNLKSRFRPIDVESDDIGKQVYSGIWVANRNRRGWILRRDMNQTWFDNYKRRYKDLGYRPVDLEAYTIDGQLRYTGIWRQNTSRPNWAPRADVDELIEKTIDEETGLNLPGMAVVIMQDGKTLYRRGFGYADIASSRWWDADTTGRLASISKAITGTLAVQLDRGSDDFDLSDHISEWLPEIPADVPNHDYSVGDLASNKACIAHSGELTDGSFMGEPYDTALGSAEAFWADASVLWCEPPTNEPHYSTPGYTLLGAALEQASGVDLATMIRQKFSDPLSLPTLRAEDPENSEGRRTALYKLADDDTFEEVERDNLSWKLGGGGMEASPMDLARWGTALLDGQILDNDGLTQLWTSPFAADVSRYANGWSQGTEDGRQVVAKDGSQRGADTYLRIYPSEKVVIAVMTNREAIQGVDPLFATEVGKSVGTYVLNWIDS